MHIAFCPFSVCVRITRKRIRFPSQSQIFSSKFVKLQHVHLNAFLRHGFTLWWSEERILKQTLKALMFLLMFFSTIITVSSISHCHPMKCHLSLNYLHIAVKVNLSWLEGNPSWLGSGVFVARTIFCLGETTGIIIFSPSPELLLLLPNPPEPPRDYEHSGWCVCHHARRGRRGWPDSAAETPDADWDSRTFQQLEPGLHHPSLCWKGNVENRLWILCDVFLRKGNSNERKGEGLQRAGLVFHSQILSGDSVPSVQGAWHRNASQMALLERGVWPCCSENQNLNVINECLMTFINCNLICLLQ